MGLELAPQGKEMGGVWLSYEEAWLKVTETHVAGVDTRQGAWNQVRQERWGS